VFHNDSISQDFKLNLKTKLFTLSCLTQSLDVIISTAMCQHSDTAHYIVISKVE